MKNLKKVLALVVALTMVLGTVSFAFTDVAEDSDAYTAVQTLSSLSILNGYEDGTFGPEKDITRAEFAAVVCRALNMEGSANGSKGATQFADVPADHWASAFIGYAAGLGIVNGYGDGNFGPEDNVTYEQAIKMLVVALGFEPMAARKGGYPTGYLVVGNTYGMTKGVKVAGDSAAANRGVVAQLTYNALDIPMMGQTGFGTNVEYKVQDGNNGTKYTTLLTGLDVVKLGGNLSLLRLALLLGLEAAPDDLPCGHLDGLRADESGELTLVGHNDDTLIGGCGYYEKSVVLVDCDSYGAIKLGVTEKVGLGSLDYLNEVTVSIEDYDSRSACITYPNAVLGYENALGSGKRIVNALRVYECVYQELNLIIAVQTNYSVVTCICDINVSGIVCDKVVRIVYRNIQSHVAGINHRALRGISVGRIECKSAYRISIGLICGACADSNDNTGGNHYNCKY